MASTSLNKCSQECSIHNRSVTRKLQNDLSILLPFCKRQTHVHQLYVQYTLIILRDQECAISLQLLLVQVYWTPLKNLGFSKKSQIPILAKYLGLEFFRNLIFIKIHQTQDEKKHNCGVGTHCPYLSAVFPQVLCSPLNQPGLKRLQKKLAKTAETLGAVFPDLPGSQKYPDFFGIFFFQFS